MHKHFLSCHSHFTCFTACCCTSKTIFSRWQKKKWFKMIELRGVKISGWKISAASTRSMILESQTLLWFGSKTQTRSRYNFHKIQLSTYLHMSAIPYTLFCSHFCKYVCVCVRVCVRVCVCEWVYVCVSQLSWYLHFCNSETVFPLYQTGVHWSK